LLLRGSNLHDAAKLDAPMDVELVLLGFSDASQAEADELSAAVKLGALSEVETQLALPQDPNLTNTDGDRPLVLACQEGHVEAVRLLLE
ncbi:ANK1, partial [Symbiodinium pilosum]